MHGENDPLPTPSREGVEDVRPGQEADPGFPAVLLAPPTELGSPAQQLVLDASVDEIAFDLGEPEFDLIEPG